MIKVLRHTLENYSKIIKNENALAFINTLIFYKLHLSLIDQEIEC